MLIIPQLVGSSAKLSEMICALQIGCFASSTARAGDLTGPFHRQFQGDGNSDWPANLDREVTAGATEPHPQRSVGGASLLSNILVGNKGFGFEITYTPDYIVRQNERLSGTAGS